MQTATTLIDGAAPTITTSSGRSYPKNYRTRGHAPCSDFWWFMEKQIGINKTKGAWPTLMAAAHAKARACYFIGGKPGIWRYPAVMVIKHDTEKQAP